MIAAMGPRGSRTVYTCELRSSVGMVSPVLAPGQAGEVAEDAAGGGDVGDRHLAAGAAVLGGEELLPAPGLVSIASAIASRQRCRSAGPLSRQLEKARAAAATAADTSSSLAWLTRAHSLPVLGSTAAKSSPVETSSPAISGG